MRDTDIAIIGMACRFPGAADPETFWRNLSAGVESIRPLSDAELLASGVAPAQLADPQYVKAAALLDQIDQFDAAFFSLTPREVEILDPQQRLFLECAWEGLERAGYVPDACPGQVGVFAGVGVNSYLLNNLVGNHDLLASVGEFQLMLANDKDYLATRAAFKLNLTGPAVTVQTACSTSLVAVHLAVQSLLNGESDIALAGGASVRVPQVSGYLYQEGMVHSPDGHCRSFDAQAQGTVGGSGVGVVVLKRLADALANGDPIHAVIKGSAVNNDGARRVGYTAPSVEGQAQVVAEALGLADVGADTVGYIEAHGTATPLGDPIEVAALTRAFRMHTDKTGYCALGSVKSNIGHLDVAAGVAGLIKATLALKHRTLPPSLHYETPNPSIDFASSPFYVHTSTQPWEPIDGVRRAGVSSFGIGGTNAHLILEEAPEPAAAGEADGPHLLLLSARSEAALDQAAARLAQALREAPDLPLADVAFTLQTGRKTFDHRRAVVCADRAEAIRALEGQLPEQVHTRVQERQTRRAVFLCPGQGAQYPGMACGLYHSQPLFRATVDRCAELLRPHLGLDIRPLLFEQPDRRPTTNHQPAPAEDARVGPASCVVGALDQTQYAQPALFVVEYALAQLWMAWGVQPHAMIGHSIGEYVVACVAGVFTLEDALRLVVARGRMMQQMPAGAMLSVAGSAEVVRPLLSGQLALAAINTPELCVVSGPGPEIAALQRTLDSQGITSRPLHTSHAFHSPMMDPIVEPFAALMRTVALQPPRIPYLSNLSGEWISVSEATDPSYWARHLRTTVRFADGLRLLLDDPANVLLEIGPGQTLGTFARAAAPPTRLPAVVTSLRHPHSQQTDAVTLLSALGRLWMADQAINWPALHPEPRRRCTLPTYPFERARHWIEPQNRPAPEPAQSRLALDNWLSLPGWKPSPLPERRQSDAPAQWLLFGDPRGLGEQLANQLRERRQRVTLVRPGPGFHALDGTYTLAPEQPADYRALIDDLRRRELLPDQIALLWGISPAASEPAASSPDPCQSLIFLTQALGQAGIFSPITISVVADQTQSVTDVEPVDPRKAALHGPAKVIPQEHTNLRCRTIDIALPGPNAALAREADRLADELLGAGTDQTVVYRGGQRFVPSYEPWRPAAPAGTPPLLRDQGVYLITGGLGRIGLLLAEYLDRAVQARLVLVGRSSFPAQTDWARWLATHSTDDPVSQTIARLRQIAGERLMVAQADTADPERLASVVAEVEARFGPINGVFHAAGVAGGAAFCPLAETSPDVIERHLRPKLGGVAALAQALGERPRDFCLLFSSLAAELGGLGFAAYAAANIAMDALARQLSQNGVTPWISVGWDGWHRDAEPRQANDLSMTADEGLAVLGRLLSQRGLGRVVVSTGSLQARRERWVASPASVDAAQQSAAARPALGTDYAAPRSELEAQTAAIWQELLGINQIGIHDNFFELGGHSLLGTLLVTRIRQQFQIELPLRMLFERATVASFAAQIEQLRLAGSLRRDDLTEVSEDEHEEIEL